MIWSFVIIFTATTVTIISFKLNETTNFDKLFGKFIYKLSVYKSENNLNESSEREIIFSSFIMNNINNNGMYFLEEIKENYSKLLNSDRLQVWLMAVLSSCIIGVSSMFPLFLISFSNENWLLNNDSSSKTFLKYLLSFAVGGLLGDVFLHLLPEASHQIVKSGLSHKNIQIYMGFWILCGIFSFGLLEVIFSHINANQEAVKEIKHLVNGCLTNGDAIHSNKSNGHIINGSLSNGHIKHAKSEEEKSGEMNVKDSTQSKRINITGYLNLLANGFDNLTHGLAVGASFLISIKMGLLTTFAIAIHEIPHEIGDFAILIKSGFNKWEAVKAQVSIASFTILGSIIVLCADSADVIGIKTAWILPFISGGFLHIALVSILPELLSEADLRQSLKQAFFIFVGISVMAFVNLIGEE